jgi:hypothetical protein
MALRARRARMANERREEDQEIKDQESLWEICF